MTRSRAESGVLAKIGIGVLEPSRAFLIAGLTVSLGCVICTLCVSQADRPSTEVLAATDPGAAGANFLQRSPSEASTPSSAPLFATEAVSSTSSTSSSSGAVSPSAASPSPSKNGHWNAFIKAEEKVLNHLASGNKGKALSVGDVAFSGPFLDRKCRCEPNFLDSGLGRPLECTCTHSVPLVCKQWRSSHRFVPPVQCCYRANGS